MARPSTLLGALVAFALHAPPATAAEPADGHAALLPLQIEGNLNDAWKDRIQDDLARGLVQAGMQVTPPEAVTQAAGVSDCANAKCFQFLSESTNARFIVRAEVAVEDRSYAIALDIFDGRDGTLAASSRESCELCGLAEVGDLVTTQAAALRKKLDVLSLEPAVLAINSDPPGATIVIDGAEIGRAPLEHPLEPGRHEARARKRGYLEQTRTIDAVQGVRETMVFELLPEIDGARRPRRDWKVPTGWTLLGVGTAGLAAGVTFLVLDERPYEAQCSDSDVDAFGNCRQRYRTLEHGIAFTAGGGALLVTGTALLIAARVAKGRRTNEVARRLRVGPGAVGVRF